MVGDAQWVGSKDDVWTATKRLWGGRLMAAGYAMYRGAASKKWCVVEMPDDWTREARLPLQSFTDRWFDTLEEARADLTGRLDRLSQPQR